MVPKIIMTVDDSVSVRQLVKHTLQGEGYCVAEAEDGVDALDQLKIARVSMVITDLNMPNMDGIELIKNLRENSNYKYIPIIMLTTESEPSKKRQGKEAGATGWIVKPFQRRQLLAVVRKLLGQ